MSLCYHGLGFILGADNSNRKEGLFANNNNKKKWKWLFYMILESLCQILGIIKLSPVVFNFDCIFSLPKAFQNV